MGVACVNGTARWWCPERVVILSVDGPEHAFAAGSCVEKGQCFSSARQFHRRRAAARGRASAAERLNACGFLWVWFLLVWKVLRMQIVPILYRALAFDALVTSAIFQNQ
jgi:hypothetical protein